MPGEIYKALTAPMPIHRLGPDGMKRSIHAFPLVLVARRRFVQGVEAFKLHLPVFLGKRRGEDPMDPSFGSSLHALLEVKDAHQTAEILHRVVSDELPQRFGRYLDAIHTFDVVIHRETRTVAVSVELKPHGADRMSWSFEVPFPPGERARHPAGMDPLVTQPAGHPALNDPRAAEFIRIARHFYPEGFPEWEDDLDEPVPAYQRTPEYQRWYAAREKLLEGEPWDGLLMELKAAFRGHAVADAAYPFGSACSRCCVYFKEPLADGGRSVTRVAGAVSALAPVYLVYVTTQVIHSDGTDTRPQLSFEPTGEARLHAETLARHIERVLGYRPFPLELADVPLPGLRVDFLHEPPTLLGALFDARDQLDNLP
jgi:hypothetical protein